MPMKKKAPFWEVILPDYTSLTVQDFTKSEARATAKAILRTRGRLPVGTVVKRIA